MSTLILAVDAITGHYTVPGPTVSGGLVATFPIAPPSTIRGFLESLCGLSGGQFVNMAFTYGYRAAPEGRGRLLRKASVWASKGEGVEGDPPQRPLHFDTFWGMKYWITVTGPEVALIVRALDGDVERKIGGPLYLGESSDIVTSVRPLPDVIDEGGGCTVVPGRTIVMPWISGRGYGIRNAVLRAYDLGPIRPPPPAPPVDPDIADLFGDLL
jgi:CRISPR-associated Cas5-like protein